MEDEKLITRLRVARVISNVFSPPVVWGVLAFPIAARASDSTGQTLLWASIYVFFVSFIPAFFVVLMVATGRITDLHVRVKDQRILPFIISILSTTIALIIFVSLDSPIMPQFALISMIEIAFILAITFFWQISFHEMSITTAVVAMGLLYGVTPAILLAPLIVIVGVARLVLRRHTLAQVIAGGLLGAAMTVVLTALLVDPVYL